MRLRLWVLVLGLAGFGGGVGCASHPLALSAQVGATIAIPISVQDPGKLGYGGLWLYDEENELYDDQRGQLTFTFTNTEESEYTETVDPLIVTRTFPDPSTDAALDGGILIFNGASFFSLTGQTVALVNVPDLPAGEYDIEIGRRIRTSETTWNESATPVPAYNGKVNILPAQVSGIDGEPNPPSGALGSGLGTAEVDLTEYMVHIYPHPTLDLLLPVNPAPAAGHLVVNFPASKAEILAVTAANRFAPRSLVTSAVTGSGVLEIDFVSPDFEVGTLAIVFTPIDPFSAGRPAPSDFTLTLGTSRLYDEDGALIYDNGSGGLQADKVTVGEIR